MNRAIALLFVAALAAQAQAQTQPPPTPECKLGNKYNVDMDTCDCFAASSKDQQSKIAGECKDMSDNGISVQMYPGRSEIVIDRLIDIVNAANLNDQKYWTAAEVSKDKDGYSFPGFSYLVENDGTKIDYVNGKDCLVFDSKDEVYIPTDCKDDYPGICQAERINDHYSTWSEWGDCECVESEPQNRMVKIRTRNCLTACCADNAAFTTQTQPCTMPDALTYGDTFGKWTDCSVTCGEGTHERYAICPPGNCCKEDGDRVAKEVGTCYKRDCPCLNEGFFLQDDSCYCFSNSPIQRNPKGQRLMGKLSDGPGLCKSFEDGKMAAVTEDFYPEWEEDVLTWTKAKRNKKGKYVYDGKTLFTDKEGLFEDMECLVMWVKDQEYMPMDCKEEDIYIACMEDSKVKSHFETWNEWEGTCGEDGMCYDKDRSIERDRRCESKCCDEGKKDKNLKDIIEKCDVQWGVWSEWTSTKSCSVQCGVGEKEYTRECRVRMEDGSAGEDEHDCCEYKTKKMEDAMEATMECMDNDYDTWASWGEWSECTESCAEGTRTRIRFTMGDTPCDPLEGEQDETESCGSEPEWSVWGEWGECSNPCGEGYVNRTRVAIGSCYPTDGEGREFEMCNTRGEWQGWSEWSQCRPVCDFFYPESELDTKSEEAISVIRSLDRSSDDSSNRKGSVEAPWRFSYVEQPYFSQGDLVNGERQRWRDCDEDFQCCMENFHEIDVEYEPCGWFYPATSPFIAQPETNQTMVLELDGDLQFSIKFDFFDIKGGDDECSYNYLVINPGTTGNNKYCNENLPKMEFTTDDQTLRLETRMDMPYPASRGFSLEWNVMNWNQNMTYDYCIGQCRFLSGGGTERLYGDKESTFVDKGNPI